MKKFKIILLVVLVLLAIAAAGGFYFYQQTKLSNPWSAKTIADIPSPLGFHRVDAPNGSYAAYLRALPLKPKGSKVQLFTGGEARLQWLSAAVVDMPMLSNAEQCADMTMRLRAEYLWNSGRYADICFTDVNGKRHRYTGGSSRKALEQYLRRMYEICSTYSVYHETEVRKAGDVRPGDVLVYPARSSKRLGHALLVADVAESSDGRRAILCVEGNTPARECHVVRNLNPLRNPWIILDADADSYQVSVFHFGKDELRHY